MALINDYLNTNQEKLALYTTAITQLFLAIGLVKSSLPRLKCSKRMTLQRMSMSCWG